MPTFHFVERRAMSEEYFIIAVFCLVDDLIKALELPPLRKRGFAPALSSTLSHYS